MLFRVFYNVVPNFRVARTCGHFGQKPTEWTVERLDNLRFSRWCPQMGFKAHMPTRDHHHLLAVAKQTSPAIRPVVGSSPRITKSEPDQLAVWRVYVWVWQLACCHGVAITLLFFSPGVALLSFIYIRLGQYSYVDWRKCTSSQCQMFWFMKPEILRWAWHVMCMDSACFFCLTSRCLSSVATKFLFCLNVFLIKYAWFGIYQC